MSELRKCSDCGSLFPDTERHLCKGITFVSTFEPTFTFVSTPEPTFTTTQVSDLTRADRERLIEAIQNDICLEVHSDSMIQADCNGERWKAESIVSLIRSAPLEQGEGK